jgi:hypothetical protein
MEADSNPWSAKTDMAARAMSRFLFPLSIFLADIG